MLGKVECVEDKAKAAWIEALTAKVPQQVRMGGTAPTRWRCTQQLWGPEGSCCSSRQSSAQNYGLRALSCSKPGFSAEADWQSFDRDAGTDWLPYFLTLGARSPKEVHGLRISVRSVRFHTERAQRFGGSRGPGQRGAWYPRLALARRQPTPRNSQSHCA